MVERQSIGDAAAAVMAGESEMHVAERLIAWIMVLRHRALGVGR